jgi:metallo-beta-lactamase family protein
MTKLSFYGATQEVTGSCFLLESLPAQAGDKITKILIDCGMLQCPKYCDIRNRDKFPFDPNSIDAVVVTHAHVDHTGRIPKLVKEGFSGSIFSTPPTKDLSELMLEDSVNVMEYEAKEDGKKPMYSIEDVRQAQLLWHAKKYHEKFVVGDFNITLYNTGHILGSAMVAVEHLGRTTLFSGDMGNPENPLLPDPETIDDVSTLIMESTYGNRVHEDVKDRRLLLERVVEASVVRGGVLMIPAFSLERTQELLWILADMITKKHIPEIPIFIDSPLAIRATRIYEKYYDEYLKETLEGLPPNEGKRAFRYSALPSIKLTESVQDSKKINETPNPKIVIAGSGMSTGGRILHHEKRYLSDPKSTILFVGYQAVGSRGRRIQDGEKEVEIMGDTVKIRCVKETIHGFSAHPDKEALFAFVQKHENILKNVYCVHGEPKALLELVQKVRDYLGVDARAPKYGESVLI